MDTRTLADVASEFYSNGLFKAYTRASELANNTKNSEVKKACENIINYLNNTFDQPQAAVLFLFNEIIQLEQKLGPQAAIDEIKLILIDDLNMNPHAGNMDTSWKEAKAILNLQPIMPATANLPTTSTVIGDGQKPASHNRIIAIQPAQDAKGNKTIKVHLKKSFRTIVFEGGGGKGIVYPAALDALSEMDMMAPVENYVGSSAGALTAFLCALGYQKNDLKNVVNSVDISSLLDRQILEKGGKMAVLKSSLLTGTQSRTQTEGEFYVNTGNNLLMTARKIIRQRFCECYQKASPEIKSRMEKYGIKAHMDRNRISFIDLKYMEYLFPNENFRELIATGTAMHGHTKYIKEQDYFSADYYPHAEPAYAVRISSSLPAVFKKLSHLVRYYIDGGITQNLPLQHIIEKQYIYPGDILAMQFTRKAKKKPDKPNSKKKIVDSLGIVSAEDSQNHSNNARIFKEKAKKLGVDFFSVSQGDIDTMDFDATTNTEKFASGYVENLQNETKKNLKEKLEPIATKQNQVPSITDSYDVTQLQNNIVLLKDKSINTEFYIDGVKVSEEYHNRLWMQTITELENQLNKLQHTQQEYGIKKADELYAKIQTRNQTFFAALNAYQQNKLNDFNDTTGYERNHLSEKNPFQFLYSTLFEISEDQLQLDHNTKAWLKMIVKYASPMDIILHTGVVGASLTMLLNQEDKDLYQKRINILDGLLQDAAKKLGFDNLPQLRDAAGQFAQLNNQHAHKQFFTVIPNANSIKAIQSPYVINDLLTLDRIQDIKAIGYGESVTKDKRSTYANNFITEIETGDTRWITDLFICVELYRKFQSSEELQKRFAQYENPKHKSPYALYIEHVYRHELGMDLNMISDASRPSWVVKLFVNHRLNNPDPSKANFSGNMPVILCDLADEVKYYFKGLGHDINNADIKNISNMTFLDKSELNNARKTCLLEGRQLTNEKLCNITSNAFTKLKPDSFAMIITTEGQSLKTKMTGNTRENVLANLCAYVNNNPLTWYDDLMGIHSPFSIKENPLMQLIMSSNLSEDTCLRLMERLENFHHDQELEKRRWIEQQKTNFNTVKGSQISSSLFVRPPRPNTNAPEYPRTNLTKPPPRPSSHAPVKPGTRNNSESS